MALVFTVNSLIRNLKPGVISSIYFPPVRYAARKGTRKRKDAKKQKIVIEKLAWSPERASLKKRAHLLRRVTRTVETSEMTPVDNVYFTSKYITQAVSVAEAVQCHRENFHPTMLDVSQAPIQMLIELDLNDGKKSTIKNFSSLVNIPHPWVDRSKKQVLVFCKTAEMQNMALDKGADAVGGVDLINKIQKGEFSTSAFDYILCHENIYLDLSVIRGILKTKYPLKRDGTLGADIVSLIHKFKFGLDISCAASQSIPDLAVIKAPVGSLKLTNEQVEENFVSILGTLMMKAPVKKDPFITWIWCTSPQSHEKFKIDYEPYLSQIELPDAAAKKKRRR